MEIEEIIEVLKKNDLTDDDITVEKDKIYVPITSGEIDGIDIETEFIIKDNNIEINLSVDFGFCSGVDEEGDEICEDVDVTYSKKIKYINPDQITSLIQRSDETIDNILKELQNKEWNNLKTDKNLVKNFKNLLEDSIKDF